MANPAKKHPNLDAIDRNILRLLQADARLPNNVLAERVGLSPSPCSRRVKLLEEAGIIDGYRTVLNRAAIGLNLTIFAGIRVDRHSAERKDQFIETILAMPEVVACHLVSGDVDILIEVVVPDMAAYETTVLNRLLALPELRDIRTSFAMRSYKSVGALPISPMD
jgi:Lrp/AsnC family transcriptional regulator, leucine-responsive regulatory protein